MVGLVFAVVNQCSRLEILWQSISKTNRGTRLQRIRLTHSRLWEMTVGSRNIMTSISVPLL